MVLLFAIIEAVVSFVLPIINGFGEPAHVENQIYYEVNLENVYFKFTLHILLISFRFPFIPPVDISFDFER